MSKKIFHKHCFTGEESTAICHHSYDFLCTIRVYKMMQDKHVQNCNCLPSCNSIIYHFNSHFKRSTTQNDSDEVIGTMSVYFADEEFLVLRRYASQGVNTLLSHIGGLLGLFLGASVLSVIEIFYFFVIRLINNLWWKKTT
jgi:acid-sensing ion channel, other